MFFAPFSNRSLAGPARIIRVLWLATVHRLGLGCFAHACQYNRYRESVQWGKATMSALRRRLARTHRRLAVTTERSPHVACRKNLGVDF